MRVHSKITKKDYAKLMTAHLLTSPYMIFIDAIGALLIFYSQQMESGNFYLFLGLGFIGLPVLIFFTVGQAYDKNKHFNERIEFTLGEHGLELAGHTFRSSFTWNQITKVNEANNFFILLRDRVILAVISKKDNSKETADELRQWFIDKGKLKKKS